MEVAGVVFRQAPCFSSNSSVNSRSFSPKQQWSRKSVIALAGCDEFSDKSHLQYYDYNGGPRMSVKEKEMKKQLKLVKGLSKNLARFGDMGFGLNLNDGLDEQVRGKMISEATEVLVGQLQKLKAEKMELKRRKKEEKAKKKAAKMMECKSKKESSSSSSSSESECEKLALSQLMASPSAIETATTTVIESPSSMVEEVENNMNMKMQMQMQSKRVGDKIEVCMGGKCMKSGAAVLLENLQKAVGGGEAAALVVGCKCMGKCRDGPNVKVGNGNPLCIGVGLEDVDSIVNDYLFGQNMMGTPAPALALALAL